MSNDDRPDWDSPGLGPGYTDYSDIPGYTDPGGYDGPWDGSEPFEPASPPPSTAYAKP